MKNILMVFLAVLVLAFFVGSGVAQQEDQVTMGSGYHPQVKFPGDYTSNLIFFRYSHKDSWRRKPRQDSVQRVSCQNALDHLNSEGKWQGSLNPDGSCGKSTIESPEWATGNRINYDEASGKSAN